jgi:hypothetical protein
MLCYTHHITVQQYLLFLSAVSPALVGGIQYFDLLVAVYGHQYPMFG